MTNSRKRRKHDQSVNAGSMADIAFLLLIFFLVTTTILNETGIRVVLPVWDENPISTPLPPRNVLNILVNSSNKLLIEKELAEVGTIKERTKEFIMNPQGLSTLPASPKKAVVSLQNDRGTSYQTYIEVYNEVKAAYNELWDVAAKRRFGKSYADLNREDKQDVRKDIPLVISEANPTDHQMK